MTTNMTNPNLPGVLISVGDTAVPTHELSGWVIETAEQAKEREAREYAASLLALAEAGRHAAPGLDVLRAAAEDAQAANLDLTNVTDELAATHPDGEDENPDHHDETE